MSDQTISPRHEEHVKYYAKHKEEISRKSKEYYQKNKEFILARHSKNRNQDLKKSRKRVNGSYHKNKEYYSVYRKEWRAKNKETLAIKSREKHLRIKFGITQNEYELLASKQNGICLICGKQPKKTFHIDHDHETGQIRGLLCCPCNQMLGLAHDNPDVLESAAKYLNAHKNTSSLRKSFDS